MGKTIVVGASRSLFSSRELSGYHYFNIENEEEFETFNFDRNCILVLPLALNLNWCSVHIHFDG